MATVNRGTQRGYGNEQRPVIGDLSKRDAVGQSVAMQARGDYEPNNRQVDYKRSCWDPRDLALEGDPNRIRDPKMRIEVLSPETERGDMMWRDPAVWILALPVFEGG